MKTKLVPLLLGCAALALLLPQRVLAGPGDPIPGRDVVLQGDPSTIVVARGKTNRTGTVIFRRLDSGRYRLISEISLPNGDFGRVRVQVNLLGGKSLKVLSFPVKTTGGGAAGPASYSAMVNFRFVLPRSQTNEKQNISCRLTGLPVPAVP